MDLFKERPDVAWGVFGVMIPKAEGVPYDHENLKCRKCGKPMKCEVFGVYAEWVKQCKCPKIEAY